MNTTKISVEARISADAKKVWNFWTTPGHITQWNFASDDWHCPKSENDLKVGGKFMSRMEAKDGSFRFDFEGVYDEIIALEKITYTMPDNRQASTYFENLGAETKVTTTFDPENENSVELQRAGWQAILNKSKNMQKQTEGMENWC